MIQLSSLEIDEENPPPHLRSERKELRFSPERIDSSHDEKVIRDEEAAIEFTDAMNSFMNIEILIHAANVKAKWRKNEEK
ncbi:Hypothetical predicted protein [Octopus vulgaris]|uniref:Uncharacterized protein n=1 Tax=Octopus vulgaris TaxID=6645 RepID=A0AA36BKT9_OCTVU|nr:Hypothetical predicted protein [Octopus vulgaris]